MTDKVPDSLRGLPTRLQKLWGKPVNEEDFT